MLALRTLAQPLMPQVLHSCWQACQGTGAIIYSPFAWAGYSIAERLGVPSFIACLQPMTVTARFPSAWSPLQRSLGGPCNRLSHIMTQQLYWRVNQPFINRWRVMELELPPLPHNGPFKLSRWQAQPNLYGFSPSLVTRPADWPEQAWVTGYWFLPQNASYKPEARLQTFLEAGPPPVFIGFGSMPDANPTELKEIVVEAVRLTGQRAVVQGEWLCGEMPDNILAVGWLPHGWLFPRCSAAVHHGGASTLAGRLRAGIPPVVVPYAWLRLWGAA